MTRSNSTLCCFSLCGVLALAGCSNGVPLSPTSLASSDAASHQSLTTTERACWGQATQVFARTGVMGEHASQQPTPRLGLRNLARALYDAGVLPDDTLQSLGVFVARELGLSIDACL